MFDIIQTNIDILIKEVIMQYNIEGGSLPVVICNLEVGETLITEGGAMSWMSSNIVMETVGQSVGKALGRLVSGESLFLNKYTATGPNASVAFASSFPGSLIPIQITEGSSMVVQKSGFLASESGVELSTAYKKKISASLFGGEGFFMQKLTGNGTAFIEIDGHAHMQELAPGEVLYINTGYLAMMDSTVTMEVEMVKGVKNIFLGGEGLFNTKVTGPGRVWIQSMPIPQFAQSLSRYIPSKG